MKPAAFNLHEAWVELDYRHVLRGVDVRIDEGEVVAVLGPNGSGKSTLVRSLLGLVPLSAGNVELYGTPPAAFREWSRIGYVPQRLTAGGGVPATVREVVSSGRIARRRFLPRTTKDRAAVDRALEAVGLQAYGREATNTLSGGQQQRVLIARALAGEPDTFVLDEPTAGVDVESQRALAVALRDLAAAGRTVVLVAHELGPLEPLVTRAVCLADGRVTHDGPPPRPEGHHALPGHQHVHPHAAEPDDGGLTTWSPQSPSHTSAEAPRRASADPSGRPTW